MTLGTMTEWGKPWVSPVVYTYDDKFNLFWMSMSVSLHSRNISQFPSISVAIFDSRQLLNTGVGLQIEGQAISLALWQMPAAAKWFIKRQWPYGKTGDFAEIIKLIAKGVYRIYKFTPSRVWMNDPLAKTDVRVEVKL